MIEFLLGCITGMVLTSVVILIARGLYGKNKIKHYKY